MTIFCSAAPPTTKDLCPKKKYPKYLYEGKNQLRKYADYCKQNGINQTLPVQPKLLASFLASKSKSENSRRASLSQMSRLFEDPKAWSAQMRRHKVVREVLGSTRKITPAVATICKRRRKLKKKYVKHKLTCIYYFLAFSKQKWTVSLKMP
jgi:hypothetical protein